MIELDVRYSLNEIFKCAKDGYEVHLRGYPKSLCHEITLIKDNFQIKIKIPSIKYRSLCNLDKKYYSKIFKLNASSPDITEYVKDMYMDYLLDKVL